MQRLIKKIFPNYETKNEMKIRLEKEVSYYKGATMMPTMVHKVERKVDQIRVTHILECDTQIEYAKHALLDQLAKHLEPFVEYDIIDDNQYNNKLLLGSIYIAHKQ